MHRDGQFLDVRARLGHSDLQGARTELERAEALAPDNFYAHYMLAVARHLGALDERRPSDLAMAVDPYVRGLHAEPTAVGRSRTATTRSTDT